MKTLQSSSRGRGLHRGRGRGRGGDARFASRFTDPRFQLTRGGHRSGRGRGTVQDAARQDPRFAKHLRQIQGGEGDSEKEEEDEESDEYSDMEDGEEGAEALSDIASSLKSDNGGGMDLSDDEAEQLDGEVRAWSPSDVEYVEPKHRLAIVNCSWDHIRSVDLYAVLFYALPLGGQLLNVAVYMSDFGKRMLEYERMHGPDLWEKRDEVSVKPPADADKPIKEGSKKKDRKNKGKESGMDYGVGDNEAEEGNIEKEHTMDDDPWEDDNIAMLQEEGEDGELFSEGKHRKYERDRMKYYYAVATFDSPETAEAVYNQLDGMDIEASGVVLDLRYVDDSEVFENPVNKADRIPANYQPLAAFKAAALSQTRFRISWDQEDVFRHRSLRDSFTGETADDDLAAYIAPPDSSEEDEVDDNVENSRVNGKKMKRAKDKVRIRKKYAALLEEIGGLPEDYGGSGEDGEADEENSDESDDDSLNRFSDVEMEKSEGSCEGSPEVFGEVEATLDLDAESKAVKLQRDVRIKQQMTSSDLGSKAELKYKLRRSEMKKKKKEMIMQEREAETAKQHAEREERRQVLRAALGTDDEGAIHLSGKEKRKQHARAVKQRLAAERAEKKKMRASNNLGVTREARQRLASDAAAEAIDTRFQSKLLSDPRFHLDVAQKDRRHNPDVVGLAATVVNARQGRRQHERNEARDDGAVEYFLGRPSKKAKRE
ncbi:uncharacterized protein TEOVI_000841700 [Trypanosoma equiperdum]|uniref:ESF1 RRM domain-containing protein n=2 Tax=Trypanozoon TaxID=39700 RepID=Q38AI3_TRYB2|nr:hypothetical protein, conserved [Trypanosoma brucei brucei TREU927]EAN78187.1 hypothetical protein, conserved [Trypanosoma brucei brucei TREU927]SCU64628.1 hypothetical protein, conserved [Trypanosoma equiperdum]